MLHGFRGDLQLFQHLVVALKHLDGIPALLLLRQVVDNGFLDVRQRVLHRAGEGVLRDGLFVLRRLDGRLRRLRDARAPERRDLHHPAAQLTGKLGAVQPVSVLPHHIHHVDGHHHGDAQLHQLRGEVQVALQVCAVDDVQDDVRPLPDQVVPGHDFLQRVGRQAVDPRKIGDRHALVSLQPALFFLHRHARPVAHKLVGAGQCIEQGRLSTVRITRKGNTYIHSRTSFLNRRTLS